MSIVLIIWGLEQLPNAWIDVNCQMIVYVQCLLFVVCIHGKRASTTYVCYLCVSFLKLLWDRNCCVYT